jgi:outer membrane immunogenic protein
MTMKILAAGLGAALLATSALAADLPSRSAPAPAFTAVPVFSWTGFYVGAHAGYGFGETKSTGAGGFNDPDGFIGGGQIGYNYQLPNRLVLGLEADLSWTDLNSSGPGVGFGASKADLNYLGTVRARIGYGADRFLPYITGGLAYGSTDVSIPGVGTNDDVRFGWTIGAGVEYAFTNNWTARVEGLYVDLQKDNVGTAKVGHELGIIRAGVNYKF